MQADKQKYVWLFAWREPQLLFEMANSESRFNPERFLTSRSAKQLREAWVVGKVGSLTGVHHAIMSNQTIPDAFFKLHNGREIPVEVTERLQEGRRRGDEEFGDIRHQWHRELADAVTFNRAWLDAVIDKKISKDKDYLPGTIVIVYHNTSLYEWDSDRITNELEGAAARRGKNIIGSIILFNGKLYGKETIQSLDA